jgi:hypothetical protein
MTITIDASHVGRTARTLLAGTNAGGTTMIATGSVVEVERVDLPLSYLDASDPGRARVLVRSVRFGDVCTMEARHLLLLTDTVGPSRDWPTHREVAEGIAEQLVEAGFGAAAEAVRGGRL